MRMHVFFKLCRVVHSISLYITFGMREEPRVPLSHYVLDRGGLLSMKCVLVIAALLERRDPQIIHVPRRAPAQPYRRF